MRKVIATEFITLDGVVEAPGGDETDHIHRGWQSNYPSQAVGKYKADELASVDALLLGRKTYDQFAGYWPGQTSGWFAERMNSIPKYVVSTGMRGAEWNNSSVLGALVEVEALKGSEGGDLLVYGSTTLVKSLLQHDLVDELHLVLYPLTVGGGLSPFDSEDRKMRTFRLKNCRTVKDGIVILEYERNVGK
ncbi:hypothetical protein HK100_009683 [Physocladia obscura]|uniref:2,5-diamino-6-ribosylamino-4(3H)-pyrimidinone 5'-phosphate reductase n=1 Tax=Physocladia obscura TaxID=109957 RepID=A0AAD5T323_9FUNG|nr:hypothetical protein HK100_009683 [Physocladia obscura]